MVSVGQLWRLNVVAGVAHLAQAGVVLALTNDLAIPVSAGFLDDDPVAVREPVTPETVFELRVGWLVAAFLLLAAADHLAVAAGPVRRWYERSVEADRNPARWLEYAVSATIMMVLIAVFTGIWDLAGLAGVAGLTVTMILFGWLVERHQRPGDADLSAFWSGSFAGAVPWLVVGVYLFGGADRPPGFVYAIFATQLALYSSFAVNQWLQFRQVGPWRERLYAERAYIVLSLVAKSLLAWLIFANVLRS